MNLLPCKNSVQMVNILSYAILIDACLRPFEGFGVYLGRFWGLNNTELIKSVLKLVHDDLGLRLFRTEYPHQFSTEEDKIEIKCRDDVTCTWIDIHRTLTQNFKDVKVFASVWSAPKYMLRSDSKAFFNISYRNKYYTYLENVTEKIDKQFGIKIERVSIVNEPEDIFATWDHMNIDPEKLGTMVSSFGKSRYRVGPETAWFISTENYLGNSLLLQSCEIILTHSYHLQTSFFRVIGNYLKGISPNISYDQVKRQNKWGKPMWMTEVSSPGRKPEEKILEEAIDFAKNIINYVGFTCVTRYYYWLAYMKAPSGESLIWGNPKVKIGDKVEKDSDRFILPKKYFVYRHFSHSSMPLGRRTANLCLTGQPIECIKFDDNYVFVNSDPKKVFKAPNSMPLCCTTRDVDYDCNFDSNSIPPQSICSSVDAK